MTEGSDTGVIRLENLAAFTEHTAELIGQSIREVYVLSPDMALPWLGAEAVTDALRRFALTHRRAQIRILVCDASAVVQQRHPWLALIRRLSKIEARVIKPEILDTEPLKGSFVLSDRRGLVYRNSETEYLGFAHYDDRPTVQQQRNLFEQYWRYSAAHPEFRVLAL
jgi:hypothetical protein